MRELSSIAWYNSYMDRGLERVPTTKQELAAVVKKYPGHLIATTACLGGELSSNAFDMSQAEKVNDYTNAQVFYEKIVNFMKYCIDLFGDDFYIECAPALSTDQKIANEKLLKISKAYNIPMVIGTDAHYLTKDDRYVHKAYLNSKNGEREIDSFYEFSRLMDFDEAEEILAVSFNDDKELAAAIIENTNLIREKISDYSLERKQIIPKVEVKNYQQDDWDLVPGLIMDNFDHRWGVLQSLIQSDEPQERYWIQECLKALKEKGLIENQEYWDRLEIEADVIKYIGNKLNDCLFAYFNTFKHYIDLFWECGSTVGPGRGSATGFLSNYLLGITQLDPIRWKLPYWRLTLINY